MDWIRLVRSPVILSAKPQRVPTPSPARCAPSNLKLMDRLIAHYLIETPLPVAQAAAVLAGEQSSGTFVEVPGETAELKQRFAARVEKVEELAPVFTPSIPT